MNEASPIVLVVGATGSIGRYIVASSLAHGFRTRALVRDGAKAAAFPPEAEVLVGNLPW